MVRLIFVPLVLIVASCLAAPGERVKKHVYDYGPGGYGGGHGGGHGGFGGYGGHGYGGNGGFGGATFPLTQSFSQSKASASSSSIGGAASG